MQMAVNPVSWIQFLPHCWKEILPSIIKPITQIVNTSLTKGILAKLWKTAIIHPLLKKAGLALPLSNFRPVSNLSFLSRVTECAMLQQFNNHCDACNLIPDYQSAYQPNYSCETALVKITNDMLWAMEHQKATNLMAIDLSSAFDTVDFSCLTQVLQNRFGIKGKALCWFENYLHPRFCKVNVGCTYSSDRELKCSVPQGSCGGPILYTIYALTLEEVVCGPESEVLSPDNDSLILKIDLHGFADDHALKNSFKAGDLEVERTCILTLESTAGNVKTWMDQNRLKMNDERTEFIVFASHQLLPKCETKTLCVNAVNVEWAEVIKYLGAWMDQHMTLRKHICMKSRTAMLNFQRIKLICSLLTQESTHTLVRGLVTSHLDYCNAIFAGLPNCLMNILQKVQNASAKLVTGSKKYDSATSSLYQLHWLPIKARVDFKILTLITKCLSGNAAEYLQNLITPYKSGRPGLWSVSQERKLWVPRMSRKTFVDRTFSVYGPKTWNNLPEPLRRNMPIKQFKAQLKTYLFTIYFNN